MASKGEGGGGEEYNDKNYVLHRFHFPSYNGVALDLPGSLIARSWSKRVLAIDFIQFSEPVTIFVSCDEQCVHEKESQ